mgnify:CR=1 FL=1
MSVNKNVLLVCSPYYQQISDNLIKGAIKVLKRKSVNYKFLYVPGALEIAPAIKLIYEKSKNNPIIDGYIALGCVIKGQTPHFDFISLSLKGFDIGQGPLDTTLGSHVVAFFCESNVPNVFPLSLLT